MSALSRLNAQRSELPNGSGAAAMLAAGIGSLLLAVIAIAADKSASIKRLTNIYKPTGPLSGVTISAIALWLAVWMVLELRWRTKDVGLRRVKIIAWILLALGFLLTFPPVGDLF